MKIEAATIEELIERAGTRTESLRQLDAFIVATAPDLARGLSSGPSITMIGYGELIWENMSSSGVWPLLAVALQKHHISMYVAAEVEGASLVQLYSDRLGRNNGKNCVRFKRFKDLDPSVLAEFIGDAVAAAAKQTRIYGRNCAQPVEGPDPSS